MSAAAYVIVWGTNEPVAGRVVEEPGRVGWSRRNGNVLLPIDAGCVLPGGGAQGWVKREFGSGHAPPWPSPRLFCPFAIRIDPARPFVHWAVEFSRMGAAAPAGLIRFGCDTTQPGTIGTPRQMTAPIALDDLAYDAAFVAVATGVLDVAPRIDGLLGLALYGAAEGVRVRRIAASVCSKEDA